MRTLSRRAALVLTLPLVTMLQSVPAEAATASGGGSLNGIMAFHPGIPTDPFAPPNTNVVAYFSTTTTGTVVLTDGSNSAMYTGTVNLAAGGSGVEGSLFGTGNINELHGSGTSATGSLQLRLATPQASGENTYVRAGVMFVVILRLDAVVDTWIYGIRITVAGSVALRVVASAVPTATTGSVVTEMVLSGPFTVGS